MVGRIFKLLCFIALIFVVGFLYHYNSQDVTIFLGPKGQLQTRGAHVIVGLFLIGFLVASLFAAAINLRHHFALRATEQKLRRAQDQHELLVEGRNLLALGDVKQAKSVLQRAIQKDPTDKLAPVLLAEAVYRLSGPKESLEALEKLRQQDKHTVESLIFAARLNNELGNHTAAYDNSVLVLEKLPNNAIAYEQAVAAAAGLERFAKAIELQQRLVQLSSGDAYDSAQRQLALLKVRDAIHRLSNSPQEMQTAIEGIAKEHRDFPEALAMLAELEEAAGRRDTATKLRKKLFEITGNSVHLESMARSWLAIERPDTALAQVEAALAAAHGKFDCTEAQLFLASLQLHLEMVDQARATLAALEPKIEKLPELKLVHTVLRAKVMRRDQDLAKAFALLASVLDARTPLPAASDIRRQIADGVKLESWASRLGKEIQTAAM